MNNNASGQPSFLTDPKGWFHRLFINEALLSILLVLCFIGVAYTNFGSARSYHYWLWLVPVFAVAAVISEWSRYKREEIDGFHYITQQLMHWGAVYVAIRVVFQLHEIGRLNNDATALALMTVMSLGTFLAGVYIGWRFLVLGVFIAFATIVAASLEAYIWVLIPIALVIIAAGVFIARWEFHRLAR